MPQSTAYKQFLSMTQGPNPEVKVLLLIAPSRCNCTAAEILLCESPDVHCQYHEPFHLSYALRYAPDYVPGQLNMVERGYADLIKRVRHYQATHGTTRPVTMVVAEKENNIAPGEEWQKLQAVAEKVVFVVRNPMLNIESFVRKLLGRIEIMNDRHQRSFDLNRFAKHQGFKGEKGQHWREMVKQCKEKRNYAPFGTLLSEFFLETNSRFDDPLMQRALLNNLTEDTAKGLGYENKNALAEEFGKPNWQSFLDEVVNIPNPNYAALSGLLHGKLLFQSTGWEQMDDLIYHAVKPYTLIDGTFIRAQPEQVLPALCSFLNVKFNETMISGWTVANGQNFWKGHNVASSAFVEKVVNSNKIFLPDERPISLTGFPVDFSRHIINVALPQYSLALCSERSLWAKDMPGAQLLASSTELNKLLNMQVSDTPLRKIDPIFATAITFSAVHVNSRVREQMLHVISSSTEAQKYQECINAVLGRTKQKSEGIMQK